MAKAPVVSGSDKLGKEANIELIRKERKANNAWHKLCRNKTAMIGLFIVVVMVTLAICAPLLTDYKPNKVNLKKSMIYLPIGSVVEGRNGPETHLLGTDALGRDIYTRLLYGARVSLLVAVGATIVGGTIGVLLGLMSGYFGGWLDAVIMRIMDGMFSFPFILLAMILVTIFGTGILNVILAIGVASIPSFARVVRGQVIIVKEEEYCNAGKVIGISHARQIFCHILPNSLSQIIVYATLRIASAIISEASLSFLGLGIELPTASWGSILKEGRECLQTAPHVAMCGGLCILITVIGFNLLGDGIRDVMDPKMKQ